MPHVEALEELGVVVSTLRRVDGATKRTLTYALIPDRMESVAWSLFDSLSVTSAP